LIDRYIQGLSVLNICSKVYLQGKQQSITRTIHNTYKKKSILKEVITSLTRQGFKLFGILCIAAALGLQKKVL